MTPRRWLVVVLAVHLALGLVYAWATPIFEASDEGAHFAVVHWLATGHGLPVQDPAAEDGPWHQEGSQPPLYYALAAALVSPIDMGDFDELHVMYPFTGVGVPGTMHGVNLYRHPMEPQPLQGTVLAVNVVRVFSLLLSLGVVALTYALALALFPDRAWLALLSAALVAFNPMALFINASVNNDNLLMLLCTAALLLTVRLMQPHPRQRGWLLVGLGVLLGLAALTKISGLVMWPVAAVGLLIGELRRGRRTTEPRRPLRATGDRRQTVSSAERIDPSDVVSHPGNAIDNLVAGNRLMQNVRRPSSIVHRLLLPFALVFGLALLVCAWWFWRNQQLYGEWLGLNTMVAVAGRRPPMGLFELVVTEWRGFVLSFWAVFGAYTILPATWVQLLYDGLVLLALAGGVFVLLRRPVRPSAESWLLAGFCLLTLVGVVRWTMQTLASQGRLLFGAIAPLSIFLAAGLLAATRPLLRLRAGRGWVQGFALTVSAGLALVAGVIPVAYIAPRYALARAPAGAPLPADLQAVHAVFADAIELVGYTASDEPVRPGESLPVTLYWRALKPMDKDYALALHLLGRAGAEVGSLDTWPGGGLAATSQWAPGTVLADTYYLPVSQAADLPARLSLDLYFWDDDSVQPLPWRALDGGALPGVTLMVGRAVPAHTAAVTPENPSHSRFEYGIELAGYDVSAEGALVLTLYWKLDGDEPVPADFTVFVHLVDEQGLPVIEPSDRPPVDGAWPTSAWVPGLTLADTHVIALPPNLQLGRYAVRLGLYDPNTGVRLTALRPDGTPWPDDAVVLSGVFEK